MIWKDEAALEEARNRPYCELCGCSPGRGMRLDACHLLSKGAGRVDIPCNLAAAHRCCHRLADVDLAARDRLRAAVCEREGMTWEQIEKTVWDVRRLPKGTTREEVETAIQRWKKCQA